MTPEISTLALRSSRLGIAHREPRQRAVRTLWLLAVLLALTAPRPSRAAAGDIATAAGVQAFTLSCCGDCTNDGWVTVDELLTVVNIALGNVEVSECEIGDENDDGRITIDEILIAVNNALNGCLDVTGEWAGSWHSRQGPGGALFATLTQTGSSVGGSLSFSGSPCFSGGTFSGSAGTDNTWSGTMTAGGGVRVDLTGTVAGNQINGSYYVAAGGRCTGDSGSFELARN